MSQFTIEDIPKVETDLPLIPAPLNPAPSPPPEAGDPVFGIPQSSAPPAGVVDAFGSRPWDDEEAAYQKSLDAWHRTSTDKIDAAIFEPDKAFKGVDLSFASNPQEGQRGVIVDSWMDLHHDEPTAPSELQRAVQFQLASFKAFGEIASSEEELYPLIQKDATKRKDVKEMHSALGQVAGTAAFNAAAVALASPEQARGGWSAARDAARKMPGYSPELEPDLHESYFQAETAAREALAPFAPEVKELWKSWQEASGAGKIVGVAAGLVKDAFLGGQGETDAALNEKSTRRTAFEIYDKLTEEERPRFMQAISVMASSVPKEEQAKFYDNIGKQNGRDLETLAQQAVTATVDFLTDPANWGEYGDTGEATPYRRRADFVQQLQNVREGQFDPVKDVFSGYWGKLGEGVVYGTTGVLATSVLASNPVTAPILFASLTENHYQSLLQGQMDSGVDYEKASAYATRKAPVGAVIETVSEMFGSRLLRGKMPFLDKFLTGAMDKLKNPLLRGATRFVVGGTEQGLQEVGQNYIDPTIRGISKAFGEDTGEIITPSAQENIETFAQVLPLALMGIPGAAGRDARVKTFAAARDVQLAAAGYTEEGIQNIRAGIAQGLDSGAAAIDGEVRDPNSESAKNAVEELMQQAASQRQAKASGLVPDIIRSAEGFTVLDQETKQEIGTSQDMPGAMRIAMTHSAALDERKADTIAYLASLLESGDQALDMAGDPHARNSFELSTVYTEAVAAAEDPASIDTFAAEAAIQEKINGGNGSITYAALGRNVPEWRGLVRTFTNRLFHGASVTTVVHETIHGMVRRAEEAGELNRDDKLLFVKAVNEVMQGKVLTKGRNAGQALGFLPAGIADADITDQMLNEAISHIAEAELLRTRKRAKDEKSLKISGGIISRNLLALSKLVGDKRLGKFRALIDGARGVLGLTSARALALQKGFREGRFDMESYEAFLDKLTGRDHQAEHNAMVREENAAIVGQEEVAAAEDSPFSLVPVNSETPYGVAKEGSKVERFNPSAASDFQKAETAATTGREIFGSEGIPKGSSLKAIIAKVKEWGLENGFFGDHPTPSLGGPVRVSASSLKNDLSHWAGPEKTESLAALPDMLAKAVLIQTETVAKGGVKSHLLAAKLEIGGESRIVSIVVRENEGKLFYDHEFVEKTEGGPSVSQPSGANTRGRLAEESPSAVKVVRNALDVKSAPFSLAPVTMVEGLSMNVASRIKDPEVKAAMFSRMLDKLAALKSDKDEIKIAFGKGYKRKAIAAPRGEGTIRKDYGLRKEAAREELETAAGVLSAEAIRSETSRRQAIREDELEDQVYAKHEGIFTNPDLVKLKEWLVHQYLADPESPLHGRLKSKSRARRDGSMYDEGGDFDGADGVPRSNFGGRLMPDQAAQELFDKGLISEPTPDAMWEALKKEAAQVPKYREYMKAAKADLAAAKEQAKAELATWARDERIKRQELEEAQKESDAELEAEMDERIKEERANYSPRNKMLRALAMYDAMLSVLPAEVRGKIGGYVQLAKLNSDEKRLEFLEERIPKIEEALDTFLGKEYRKMLDKILKAASPKKDVAGKKRKGSLGAQAHRFFDHVNGALDMNEGELQAALEKVNEELAEEGDPETLGDLAEEWQILRTFGNFDEKSALEKHDAVELAQKVFKTGRNSWRMIEETRLADVRQVASSARIEAGNGDVRDIQQTKATAQKLLESLTERHWSLRSFREVLDLMFGEDSATAKRFGIQARKCFTARTKAMIQLQRQWKDGMEKATGLKGRDARQRVYEMQANQTLEVLVSPEIFHETKIPIDTFFDSEKKADLGLSPEEIVTLTEQFENLPPDSRKKYLTLERQITTGRGAGRMVKFTEAEAIHLSMTWAQDGYKAALKKHGFGADFQAEIEEKLTPEAKELREWLADYYRDNFPALAALYKKMFGVDLRKVENYAPGGFYHTGTNETPLDPSAGIVTGGDFKQGIGNGGDFAQGWQRQRKKHTAVPKINNAFDLFFSHANQTIHWLSMAELSREMHGVLGQPDVKIAMEALSPGGAHALREWLKAIDGNGVAMAASGKLMNYLLQSQAYMAMAWKASTAVKNFLGSVTNNAYGVPLHEYIRGAVRLAKRELGPEYDAVLSSDTIQNKLHGGFAPEVRAAIGKALSGRPSWTGDMLRNGLEIHGTADAFGNAIGGTISFDYHFRQAKKENPGMSDPQAKAIAMEIVTDHIARYSQPAEVIDRSLYELNLGSFGKMMFLFGSEARQKSSLYLTALGHSATLKATRKDLRVLFIAHLVMAPLMHTITSAFRDAFDPDDDEWLDEKYWNPRDFLITMITGPFAGIPLVRDLFSGFTSSNSPLSAYATGGKALVDLFAEEPTGDEIEWYEGKIHKVLQGIGAGPGVAGNIYKQAAGAARNIGGD